MSSPPNMADKKFHPENYRPEHVRAWVLPPGPPDTLLGNIQTAMNLTQQLANHIDAFTKECGEDVTTQDLYHLLLAVAANAAMDNNPPAEIVTGMAQAIVGRVVMERTQRAQEDLRQAAIRPS